MGIFGFRAEGEVSWEHLLKMATQTSFPALQKVLAVCETKYCETKVSKSKFLVLFQWNIEVFQYM